MNDINRQRQECESKLKKSEEEKKLLEKDLKKKKKDFHKVLRRTKKNSRKNNGKFVTMIKLNYLRKLYFLCKFFSISKVSPTFHDLKEIKIS
jgi:DNA gyrase/topoisomerase IV subunit A